MSKISVKDNYLIQLEEVYNPTVLKTQKVLNVVFV